MRTFEDRRHPPRLRCCSPAWGPFPSGWKWRHSIACPRRLRAGQWVDEVADSDELLPDPDRRQHYDQDEPEQIPITRGLLRNEAAYVDAHLDDEDDDGRPWPKVLEDEGGTS